MRARVGRDLHLRGAMHSQTLKDLDTPIAAAVCALRDA
jgi:hypothetical protein